MTPVTLPDYSRQVSTLLPESLSQRAAYTGSARPPPQAWGQQAGMLPASSPLPGPGRAGRLRDSGNRCGRGSWETRQEEAPRRQRWGRPPPPGARAPGPGERGLLVPARAAAASPEAAVPGSSRRTPGPAPAAQRGLTAPVKTSSPSASLSAAGKGGGRRSAGPGLRSRSGSEPQALPVAISVRRGHFRLRTPGAEPPPAPYGDGAAAAAAAGAGPRPRTGNAGGGRGRGRKPEQGRGGRGHGPGSADGGGVEARAEAGSLWVESGKPSSSPV